MKIGQVIREVREAHKATLEEIAFAAKTNASNLSRIERGKQGYSHETLEGIASALGVTVSELHRRAEDGLGGTVNAESNEVGPASTEHLRVDPVVTSKYTALTQEHRELVDEFMTMLLRRQRTVHP